MPHQSPLTRHTHTVWSLTDHLLRRHNMNHTVDIQPLADLPSAIACPGLCSQRVEWDWPETCENPHTNHPDKQTNRKTRCILDSCVAYKLATCSVAMQFPIESHSSRATGYRVTTTMTICGTHQVGDSEVHKNKCHTMSKVTQCGIICHKMAYLTCCFSFTLRQDRTS